MTMPEMQYVESRNIEAIGYDGEGRQLYVRFLQDGGSGALYVYHGVEEWVYDEFLAAPSKGRYLHQNIKGQYPYDQLG